MRHRITRLPRFAKTLILFCVDAVLSTVAYWTATIARVGGIPSMSQDHALIGTALVAVLMPSLAIGFGFYRSVTRFHTPHMASRAGAVSAFSGVLLGAIAWYGGARTLQAAGFGLVFSLVFFVLLLLSRTAARWILGRSDEIGVPVAIYGAGSAGRQLAAMLIRGTQHRPVALIDDDPNLKGRLIEDLPVLNPKERRFLDRLQSRGVREVLIAIPSLKPSRRRDLLEFLSGFPFRIRTVPALAELVAKEGKGIGELVDISPEDLLGRDPVAPLPGLVESCIKGKTVLVTGGGGSIGSELCRQALALVPKKLLVFEQNELALYEIEQELRAVAAQTATGTELEFVLGSVTDPTRINWLLRNEIIDTIYHAAANKHVPIVELNPVEGFRNNIYGTWYMARAALEAGVSHFVLISSDKAVKPTNVMGATKRVAELVVEVMASRASRTVFTMVRFGNVLASSGSVVPLFQKQIRNGGPITLTHPEVTRYFMTIREAVELVIQAGAIARGGELYVLDMGTPVRIKELAEKMVRLSGQSLRDESNPGSGIAIEVIGLRPGEKLQEELFIDGDVTGTLHPRIWQVREQAVNLGALEEDLLQMEKIGHDDAASDAIRAVLSKWVTGFPDKLARQENNPLRSVRFRTGR